MKEFLQKLKGFITTKHFVKQTGYILLTYIIIIGGIILYLDAYTNHGEKIKVPRLLGMNASKAETILEELDLKMELLDSIYRPDLPTGTILSQDPLPTNKSLVFVKSGRIIRVSVSKRTQLVQMPSLIDKSQRFAESVLTNRGLKYRIQYVPTSEANGAVLKQLYKGREIKEGVRIPVGDVVTIVVGQNDTGMPALIPNLVGITISEAKGRLGSTSLLLQIASCEGCVTGEDSTAAKIYSQSPEFLEGVELPAGTTIMINATKE